MVSLLSEKNTTEQTNKKKWKMKIKEILFYCNENKNKNSAEKPTIN
jgi:hypothetical protein